MKRRYVQPTVWVLDMGVNSPYATAGYPLGSKEVTTQPVRRREETNRSYGFGSPLWSDME